MSFKDLGLSNEDLVFNFEGIGKHQYYKVPSIEISYQEKMAKPLWKFSFNETAILDKTDHAGHSTIILMNRKKITELEHHDENTLIVLGEFTALVQLNAEKYFVNLFI